MYIGFYFQTIWSDRASFQRTADHSGKDKHSHLFKHACNENHKDVDLDNIKVIDSGYHNNRFKRKISEALYILQYNTTLNT